MLSRWQGSDARKPEQFFSSRALRIFFANSAVKRFSGPSSARIDPAAHRTLAGLRTDPNRASDAQQRPRKTRRPTTAIDTNLTAGKRSYVESLRPQPVVRLAVFFNRDQPLVSER
jgi:hypothetical protein